MGRKMVWIAVCIVVLLSNCNYRKGDAYTYSETSDTLRYFILTSGSGRHVSRKIMDVRIKHILKNDDCRIVYVSDSARISHQRSILLFNSVLPDMEDDILSKGIMGAFGSKQIITYLVVTRDDFERYFLKAVENQR
jgi:hypothetical protein